MTRQRLSSVLVRTLTALAVPLGAEAQEIRLGTELQVNTYTPNTQTDPSVATDADGDFVVAWSSSNQNSVSYDVFARRFSSAGTALATEFRVNTYILNSQRLPSVAADSDGDFVVVWQSAQDGYEYGIFARRFSSAGTALAVEFQVNTYTPNTQRDAVVAAEAGGDFVVAWSSYGQDGSGYYGVFARRFSSAGTALATEFQVATFTGEAEYFPSVAADSDGDFIVAWDSFEQDGDGAGVFARRFSSAGSALATEFQVNVFTMGYQSASSVAASASGDFVVAWTGTDQDGAGNGVFARRFASAGQALTLELQVNTYTTSAQSFPSASADASGDFVIAWQSSQDGGNSGIFARRFSSAGSALAVEFQVNTYTPGSQIATAVAVEAGGDFVVTWASSLQDGSASGVFAQRFAQPNALDIDGNGSVGALTDGLLMLRYLFGFRGATLITGAVGAGCIRCDAPSIEAYIASF